MSWTEYDRSLEPAAPAPAAQQAGSELRRLYAAACRAELSSTEGRTFEEWRDKVSDYGLDDARQALLREAESAPAARPASPPERERDPVWQRCKDEQDAIDASWQAYNEAFSKVFPTLPIHGSKSDLFYAKRAVHFLMTQAASRPAGEQARLAEIRRDHKINQDSLECVLRNNLNIRNHQSLREGSQHEAIGYLLSLLDTARPAAPPHDWAERLAKEIITSLAVAIDPAVTGGYEGAEQLVIEIIEALQGVAAPQKITACNGMPCTEPSHNHSAAPQGDTVKEVE